MKIEYISETSAKNHIKFMIFVSSLPEDLQVKYYSRLKKDAGIAPEITEEKFEKTTKSRKTSRSFEELSTDEREKLNFWCVLIQEWQDRV